jgi:hypothetical protein
MRWLNRAQVGTDTTPAPPRRMAVGGLRISMDFRLRGKSFLPMAAMTISGMPAAVTPEVDQEGRYLRGLGGCPTSAIASWNSARSSKFL